MTDQVPAEAIVAAAGKIPAAFVKDGRVARRIAREMLEAAMPFIRAAGREPPALVLAWRDELGEEICRSVPLRPGTRRIGIPLHAEHADLLEAETP